MGFLHSVFTLIDRVHPTKIAYAHCDIPCGIYDPHLAQMAAHTVIRMVNLIHELQTPGENPTFEQRKEIIHKISRLTAVKEEHAEICKREIRILWGDYFKPEHAQKFPELHELVWKVMKLGSKAKQGIDLKSAEELLETVNKIAGIFWKTKGIDTVKGNAPYPTEKETVYPKIK
ncbi:MAG: superoxide dismutase, Ni [Candidatus Aenigmarchaeota archaeon]|nr:superoxide dismutase, Ni [Candidatus Aenigmarchaeota archaeon]